MKKKLLCLNVELLKAFEQAKPAYALRLPCPRLCSAFVTPELIDSINKAQRLIEEHDLEEVAYHTAAVNWFNSLDDIIFQEIRSNLHVTRDCIYFSGAFAPEKTPVFVSTRLPLLPIAPDDTQTAKEINLSLLSSKRAQALIMEIENLDNDMKIAWERLESLQSLSDSLDELAASSAMINSRKSDALAHELTIEIKQLEKATEGMECSIEHKCEFLCKHVLGISLGDHIITQIRGANTHQEIQIGSVSYHDGTIFLTGLKVLKNGSLGKRSESAYISLISDDEH